ncbi:S8 family serine peptidase [Massilia sp. WG5]|nr:S8 family serine peptidase [Massilia sp. WG5]
MRKPYRYGLAAGLLASMLAPPAGAGVLTPELAAKIAERTSSDRLPVIIQMPDRLDLSGFRVSDRRKRDNAVFKALKSRGAASAARLTPLLAQFGIASLQQLWIVNAVAVTLPVWAVQELARNPLVGRIGYDGPVPFASAPKAAAVPSGSWNLDAVAAPALWAMGLNGGGAVVASLDTGVDASHPDLAASWRGGANSWYDPYSQHATPYDANGHGTQTMGLMVGASASGVPVGMAPGARWIAARVFDDSGNGTMSRIHLAFQWLLDPDGNVATLDAPNVVNASWGLNGIAPGSCNTEFADDILALKAAGISIVFAGGNNGPDPATAVSPASNPGAIGVGSLDAALALDPYSSRGPSACDGGVFPKLVAPGVNVVSTDLSFGGLPLYATVSGTSFAAPHVAGALALLASAFPAAPMATIETALIDSARDLGEPGADNQYGYGIVDVGAARELLASRAGGAAPVITSTAPATAVEGQRYQYALQASDADGGALAYSLKSAPAGMSIDAATGLISWVPTHAQTGANGAVAQVADPRGLLATQGFTVTVAALNSAPVANADSYTTGAGKVLSVAAPGVLGNDRDADGDAMHAVLVGAPAHGTLVLDPAGSFRYTPAAGYSGADGFSYRAADAAASSAVTSVSLTVQPAATKPPVAVADSYTAPVYRSSPYAARSLAVLANDNANGGTIAAATVEIVSAPAKGGTARVGSNGTIAYTPALRFSGTETFTYRVKNTMGQWSNSATVTVKVQ